MRRKSKTPVQMGQEKNTLIRSRVRFDLTRARKAASIARKEALVLIASNLLRRDHRWNPLPRRHRVLAARKELRGSTVGRRKNASTRKQGKGDEKGGSETPALKEESIYRFGGWDRTDIRALNGGVGCGPPNLAPPEKQCSYNSNLMLQCEDPGI